MTEKGNKTIDWAEVHGRLEAARDFLESCMKPSPEEKRRILKRRAEDLAKDHEATAEAGSTVEVVEFSLAYERYGIETSYVREVYPLSELTPLPCTPPFVAGIINVRGRILSVLDIKKFFDIPERGLTDLNKVIILGCSGMEFGILADVILGVKNILLSELQQSIPTLTDIREEYLKGVTKDRVTVLHAAKILTDNNLIVRQEVTR